VGPSVIKCHQDLSVLEDYQDQDLALILQHLVIAIITVTEIEDTLDQITVTIMAKTPQKYLSVNDQHRRSPIAAARTAIIASLAIKIAKNGNLVVKGIAAITRVGVHQHLPQHRRLLLPLPPLPPLPLHHHLRHHLRGHLCQTPGARWKVVVATTMMRRKARGIVNIDRAVVGVQVEEVHPEKAKSAALVGGTDRGEARTETAVGRLLIDDHRHDEEVLALVL